MKAALSKWRKTLITIALLFLIVLLGLANNGRVRTDSSKKSELFPSRAEKNEVAGAQTTITLDPSSSPLPLVNDLRQTQQAEVLRVIDGDTLEVLVNGQKESVRVIGVDTPEVVDPRKTIECLGREASVYAKEYFAEKGETVWLEMDPSQGDRDKYRRLLRFVFTENKNEDFGKMMIMLGYASEYTYNTPYKYQELYRQAETDARAGKKGLWADDACLGQSDGVTGSTTIKTTHGEDKDCQDFSSQEEAQGYFQAKGGSATNNVDKLDGEDRDGRVCETLP
jgi:micrococcal nuclease